MRGKRITPIGPALPNERSPKTTPASLKIDLWYCDLKIWERWTWPRFAKLATFLSLTAEELASVVGFPHNQIPAFQEHNHLFIGTQRALSTAMLLTILEAHFLKHLSKDVVENLFPEL